MCDEPTGNLDTKSGEEVMRLLHELSDNLGVTLIVVTHDEKLPLRWSGASPLRTARWGAALVKAEFLLTGRYIRKHKKQFFASIACIAVFAASIGAVQLFRLSSDNNTREERFSQEGRLGGYAQDADPSLITDGELENGTPARFTLRVRRRPISIPMKTRPMWALWTSGRRTCKSSY